MTIRPQLSALASQITLAASSFTAALGLFLVKPDLVTLGGLAVTALLLGLDRWLSTRANVGDLAELRAKITRIGNKVGVGP